MPAFLLPAILGAAGLVGGALKGKGGKTTTTTSSTTTPTFDPAASPMRDMLLKTIMGRIGSRSSFGAGLRSNAITNANQVFSNIGQAAQDRRNSLGLTGSPVEAAGRLNLDIARGGAITQRLNEIPLLEEQNDQANLGMASNLLSLFRGQKTTGTSTGQQDNGLAGMVGGGLEGLGGILGFLYGTGRIGGGGRRPTGTILDSYGVS